MVHLPEVKEVLQPGTFSSDIEDSEETVVTSLVLMSTVSVTSNAIAFSLYDLDRF